MGKADMNDPMDISRRRALLAGLGGTASLLVPALAPRARAGRPVLVAAASDLRFALGEIVSAWQAAGNGPIEIVYGSSGNFARQIRQGAPFELYLSADEHYVRDLAEAGLMRDEGRLYALGRLALLLPTRSPLKADGSLEDLAAALEDGRLKRFAIANPEHAPYGARAREALQNRGLWEKIEPRLVYGENVSQAMSFALSGGTEGGIVAWSLALAPPVTRRSRSALIPADYHSPLRQRMALTRKATRAAEAFMAHLASPAVREVLARYGFALPEDDG